MQNTWIKNEEFIKFDTNKPQLSLIKPSFINNLGLVLTQGAKKYGKNNWKTCDNIDRYKDALYRHWMSYLSGEKFDKESGFSHLHHIAANTMFLDHLEEVENVKN